MNNGTFIATKVYIISEKNKYSRLFVKKFSGICALLAVVNGNIELPAPVVNRIALVVNGNRQRVALRVAKIAAWTAESTTLPFLAIDGVAHLGSDGNFGTAYFNLVVNQTDLLGDVTIVGSDDAESIIGSFPYLYGVELQGGTGYLETDVYGLVVRICCNRK